MSITQDLSQTVTSEELIWKLLRYTCNFLLSAEYTEKYGPVCLSPAVRSCCPSSQHELFQASQISCLILKVICLQPCKTSAVAAQGLVLPKGRWKWTYKEGRSTLEAAQTSEGKPFALWNRHQGRQQPWNGNITIVTWVMSGHGHDHWTTVGCLTDSCPQGQVSEQLQPLEHFNSKNRPIFWGRFDTSIWMM